jgi:hypothetical protein
MKARGEYSGKFKIPETWYASTQQYKTSDDVTFGKN